MSLLTDRGGGYATTVLFYLFFIYLFFIPDYSQYHVGTGPADYKYRYFDFSFLFYF